MPVGVPPKGGPLGRSRSRLSASGLTTYLRCPRQWYLTRKVGISSPSSIGQVTGLVIEDALCRVLMHRPGPMDSLDTLRSRAYNLGQKKLKRPGMMERRIGMLAYGNVMIPIGQRSKFRIMKPRSETASTYSSRRLKPVSIKMEARISKHTVQVRFHFAFHHLLGVTSHISLYQKRSDHYKRETGL